jgi:hypothetical protein
MLALVNVSSSAASGNGMVPLENFNSLTDMSVSVPVGPLTVMTWPERVTV